jgi:hypothetical protein
MDGPVAGRCHPRRPEFVEDYDGPLYASIRREAFARGRQQAPRTAARPALAGSPLAHRTGATSWPNWPSIGHQRRAAIIGRTPCTSSSDKLNRARNRHGVDCPSPGTPTGLIPTARRLDCRGDAVSSARTERHHRSERRRSCGLTGRALGSGPRQQCHLRARSRQLRRHATSVTDCRPSYSRRRQTFRRSPR